MAVLQFANGLELEIEGGEMVEVIRDGRKLRVPPIQLRRGDVMVVEGVTSGDGPVGSRGCLESDSSI